MITDTATAHQYDRRVDESSLIASVLTGDRGAARALYDAHVPRIYRVVYRLCGDDELAQDFTQEAFIRAFDQLHRFRGESSLGTWLHRVAVTVTLNGLRKQNSRRNRELPIEAAKPVAASAVEGEPDLKEKLHAAIEALPEHLRTIIILYDIEGYTHPEIAAMLKVPEGTSKSRLFSARAQLRTALAPFYERLEQ